MISTLDDLLTGIRTHALVCPAYYADLEWDDALDQRDSRGPFDSDWGHLYNATKPLWSNASTEVRSQVDTIRKEAFLVVSGATGQHEIASYVSDDFDLMCRCLVLGIEHPMTEYLLRAYQTGIFPLPAEYSLQKSNDAQPGASPNCPRPSGNR